jgi:sec-independent protein translocase protein TatA
MFNSIGIPELAIVLLIVLIIFGPKRLPGLGKSLGSGMREFKDSLTGKTKADEAEEAAEEREDQRAQVAKALGRPEGEESPLEGEVVSDRQ